MADWKKREIRIKGNPICTGVAIGKPFLFIFSDDRVPEFPINREEIGEEINRYRRALYRSKQEVRHLQKQLELDGAHEGIMILDTHLQIMRDDLITGHLENQIRHTKKNAEYVFQFIMNDYEKKFSHLSEKIFKERTKDVQDISRRIMRNLKKSAKISLADIPMNSIVFASDLVPSEAAEAQKSRVGAFVTEFGGETSHAAIIARSKGIPYVSSIDFHKVEACKDAYVIVDGRTGEVIINPTETTLSAYQALQYQLESHLQNLNNRGNLTAETMDGYQVKLTANVEMLREVELVQKHGGDGIGLFRSEYICISSENFPSEEKQFQVYKELVLGMKGRPVTIRTFDIGGDKGGSFLPQGEPNPFLGCRALRYLLREPEIFKTQLCAILKASAYGTVRLMFPMVSGSFELVEAKKVLQKAREELDQRGVEYAKNIQIGCMIEIPSAAITSDEFAKQCDFLSIGTNDLVQYSLAVDRGNQMMSYLYNPADPSVIRLIKMVVIEANRNGIPVSVCGEIAADPRFTTLLLGLGVHELSCSARFLPIVKNAIRGTNIISACKLAEEILMMTTAEEIQKRLNLEYKNSVPHDLFHNIQAVTAS
ncbi:MAG: Phosphoenolpyruvate-protein phosphotransferase [Chlamydiae bacterium]|nr:Phosphoenolpyruvate-protein phosphotransferase [Chlamydiota bacterium]